jgi:hypothetical protein
MRLLKVEVNDGDQADKWVVCFEKQGIDMPKGSYFGISAATNEHPDTMELLEMIVQMAQPTAAGEAQAHDPQHQPGKKAEAGKDGHSAAVADQQHHGASTNTGKITTTLDADALGKIIEAAVQKQLHSVAAQLNQRLEAIESQVGPYGELLGHMGKSINGIEDHLQGISAKVGAGVPGQGAGSSSPPAHSQQAPSHGSLDNHAMLSEVMSKIDHLRATVGKEQTGSFSESAFSGKLSLVPHWVWFIALQIFLIIAYVLYKSAFDRREKKIL